MRFIVAFSRALTRKRTPVRPGPDAAGPRSAGSTSYFRSRFLFASRNGERRRDDFWFCSSGLPLGPGVAVSSGEISVAKGREGVEFVVRRARRFVYHRCLDLAGERR